MRFRVQGLLRQLDSQKRTNGPFIVDDNYPRRTARDSACSAWLGKAAGRSAAPPKGTIAFAASCFCEGAAAPRRIANASAGSRICGKNRQVQSKQMERGQAIR